MTFQIVTKIDFGTVKVHIVPHFMSGQQQQQKEREKKITSAGKKVIV